MALLLPSYLRLSKALLFSLLLTCTLLASFSAIANSESQHQSVYSHVLLSRRNLLVNEGDFLGEVVPRKKKEIVSDSNDGDSVAKKKSSEASVKKKKSSTGNNLNEDDEKVQVTEKKKKSSTPPSLSSSSSSSSKNITNNKAIKPKIALSKNETKLVKPKNETKLVKPSISASSKDKDKQIKQTSSKKVDEGDDSSSRSPKITKLEISKPLTKSPKSDNKTDKEDSKKQKSLKQKQFPPSWISRSGGDEEEEEEDDDLVSEFRNLPTKFHQTFIPDLHRISTTSKVYLTKYNKQITKGFKPYVGTNYSYNLATLISFVFLLIPLLLLSLVFHRIKTYFSLQKLIIFIQIYLSIYFSILCFSSLITGLESLRFFYLTSQTTYVWLQILQTLAYVLYLLLLLMYLVLVFTTESDLGQKLLGLAQTFVGFTVGLHYYMTVFHRVVLRQPPRSSWKIHGIYATCFLVICLFAGAERRKKVYLVEGGEEGKTS